MVNRRKNIINTKEKKRTPALLFMFFFTVLFLIISLSAEQLDNYSLQSIPTKNGLKTIYHQPDVEDINVLFDDGWYFFPDMTAEQFDMTGNNFIDLMKLPHAENVSISSEYGWNDLGPHHTWVNTDEIKLEATNSNYKKNAMYLMRVSLSPNTDTLYLHLDDIHGIGMLYCNGKPVGQIGTDEIIGIDVSHGSITYPVNSNPNTIIDIEIFVQSDARIKNPGITANPSLTSSNDEDIYLVANSIWFSFQLFIFVVCIIGGIILVRTFVNKRKFIVVLLLETLYTIFSAIDNNFLVLNSILRAIICQVLLVTLIVLSYFFISYLFYDKELSEKHKLLKIDYIAVALIGIAILLTEFLNRHLATTVYPTVSALTLMMLTVIIGIIKIVFLYSNNKNSGIALIFISAYMFSFIYMINCKTTLWGIKIYTIYYVILFLVILVSFSNAYVKQVNELSSMSSRLQFLLKEKTQHISEINKDLYNTNKKLLENEEARKNVLSNVSHDLRTPITAIRGYAELLQSAGQNMKPEQVNNYLGNIIKRSTQMERIVSDIVELTRMESNTNEFQFADVSMAELLDELYMMYDGDVRGTEKKLQIDLPETDLLMVKADPKKISRVFENLISNAINYTYDAALIKIKAWREGNELPVAQQTIHVTISDNGIGIPQEEIDNIFDRFYRAKNSGKNIKGTGLGLSIVKTIIDHHDASITVKSTLGSGTEFHIVMKATY